MKKLATVVFALLLGASLSFAQAAGGGTTTGKTDDTSKSDTSKKGKKGKKGGKKSKKGSTGDSTPPPK
jgi:hypothetical protein